MASHTTRAWMSKSFGFPAAHQDGRAHASRLPSAIHSVREATNIEWITAAEAAYRFLVDEHESSEGWGPEPDTVF